MTQQSSIKRILACHATEFCAECSVFLWFFWACSPSKQELFLAFCEAWRL